MTLLSKRGQSTGEYAVLFAIVLGAVIAMQGYVRNRIAGAVQTQADNYSTAAGSGSASVGRTSDTASSAELDMTDASTGTIDTGSVSHSTVTNP